MELDPFQGLDDVPSDGAAPALAAHQSAPTTMDADEDPVASLLGTTTVEAGASVPTPSSAPQSSVAQPSNATGAGESSAPPQAIPKPSHPPAVKSSSSSLNHAPSSTTPAKVAAPPAPNSIGRSASKGSGTPEGESVIIDLDMLIYKSSFFIHIHLHLQHTH